MPTRTNASQGGQKVPLINPAFVTSGLTPAKQDPLVAYNAEYVVIIIIVCYCRTDF